MPARCVALLSGGLDSQLAIRLMQAQGVEVEALTFKTMFTCCQDQAGQAARQLGVRLTVLGVEDDYLDLLRSPRFGYGKGANPCVDCRIYMFEKARQAMQQFDAQFVVSGELVGQRPMSQKRRDLEVIASHSDLEDLLLRPLSAKVLPPTLPEREGWVDREQLHGFVGRNRKPLIELARQLGLQEIPTPSTGCALTEPFFSLKVYDLMEHAPEAGRWEFELLKLGRHFRYDDNTKAVVGRNETDNTQLIYMHQLPEASNAVLLLPTGFAGPVVMVVGEPSPSAVEFGAGLIARYAKNPTSSNLMVRASDRQRKWTMVASQVEAAQRATTLATVKTD